MSNLYRKLIDWKNKRKAPKEKLSNLTIDKLANVDRTKIKIGCKITDESTNMIHEYNGKDMIIVGIVE